MARRLEGVAILLAVPSQVLRAANVLLMADVVARTNANENISAAMDVQLLILSRHLHGGEYGVHEGIPERSRCSNPRTLLCRSQSRLATVSLAYATQNVAFALASIGLVVGINISAGQATPDSLVWVVALATIMLTVIGNAGKVVALLSIQKDWAKALV